MLLKPKTNSFPGFEDGGPNTPSNIYPWSIIGNETNIIVSTDRTSCFIRNKVALRMEVLCDNNGSNICPAGGVGVYNPGFWGMVRHSLIYNMIFNLSCIITYLIGFGLRS